MGTMEYVGDSIVISQSSRYHGTVAEGPNGACSGGTRSAEGGAVKEEVEE
jgi:hypothetical protein